MLDADSVSVALTEIVSVSLAVTVAVSVLDGVTDSVWLHVSEAVAETDAENVSEAVAVTDAEALGDSDPETLSVPLFVGVAVRVNVGDGPVSVGLSRMVREAVSLAVADCDAVSVGVLVTVGANVRLSVIGLV